MKADEATLARLMAMSQTGDRIAYETLLRECQHWLRSYFARRVSPMHLDDLVQETLVALHHKLTSYDHRGHFYLGLQLSPDIAGSTNSGVSTGQRKMSSKMGSRPRTMSRPLQPASVSIACSSSFRPHKPRPSNSSRSKGCRSPRRLQPAAKVKP